MDADPNLNPNPNPNQDVGWCVGVIQKCNGDKRKTVDGYSARHLQPRAGASTLLGG